MKKQFLIVVFFSTCSMLCAQQIAPFKAGDRVAFVGNSITHGGHYHSYIWLYYMTHFPSEKIWITNCGVGGDTAEDILRRIDNDVISKNPSVIALTFGMNDSDVKKSRKSFLELEKKLQKLSDARMVMIGSSPYDQTSAINNNISRGKNDLIQSIVAFQDSTAKANRWDFVDFNSSMCEVNERMHKENPAFTVIGSDRVHPDNDGHMLMAYLFLKAQGMVGKPVADFCINARRKRAEKSENCTIDNISSTKDVLSFDYLAEALPYPLDTIPRGWNTFKRPQSRITQTIPDFNEEMNSERLSITGLKGTYRLLIDDILIDTLSAQMLEDGVNLTDYRYTPQYRQALAVMELNEERWGIEYRMRDFALLQYSWFLKKHNITDFTSEDAARIYRNEEAQNSFIKSHYEDRKAMYDRLIHPEVRQLLQQEQELIVRTIYTINNPVVRHFRLEKIK